MKNHFIILTLVLFLLQFSSFPQIPNSSFENWTGGNPDNWTTNNIIGYLEPVTKSGDAHSGSFSAKMEMMTALNTLFQPVLNAGQPGVGVPVSQRHSKINFYYKYFPTTTSVSLVISVGMYKNSQFIGVGVGSTKSGSGSFTKMTASINYFGQEVPDAATIYVTLIDSLFNPSSVGSYAIVDDFYFDQLIGVQYYENDQYHFSLSQNYPNPFNPDTKISWQSSISGWQTLRVYNILGREVATLVDEYKPAGVYEVTFDGKDLPSGAYIYKIQVMPSTLLRTEGEEANIQAGSFTAIKKMILLK
jgi:hypothetical protein